MVEVVSFSRNSRTNARLFPVVGSRVAFVLIAMAVFFALWPTPLMAQRNTWKAIKKFNTSIGCAFFFDEDHGLLGSGVRWSDIYANAPCMIYKTTDGGASWITSAIPDTIAGAVTSISMQDTLIGYASILPSVDYSSNGTFGNSSLWKTTDGGSSWFDPFQLDHAITCVYAQNGLILITKWDKNQSTQYLPPDPYGGDYSYDGGVTWTQDTDFRRCNGIAFSDSLNGVVTEMNPNLPGNNFWVTTDAGRSWQPTVSNEYESWSIYAVPGTGIYFCANESQWYVPHASINWSTDGGFTWSERASFPAMHFTGSIAGVGKTLYIQSDTGTAWSYADADSYWHGMYRSDDTGANWHFINGPTTSRDTRFAVTGCIGQVVYAFDASGGVYKTVDGGDGTLTGLFSLTSDTIQWLPNVCGDTLAFSVTGLNCLPITIDSILLPIGSEFQRLPNDGVLPQTLSEGDTAEIRLLYAPTKGGTSATEVTIYAHSGEDVVTKEITIITKNNLVTSLALSKDTSIMNASACQVAVDTILLSNVACPGMTLDSVTVPIGEVHVVNALPALMPDTTLYPLRFLFQPDSAGTDSIIVHLYAHDGRRNYDTTISIFVQSLPISERFALDSDSVTMGTSYCKSLFKSIRIATPSCDSMVFDSVVSSNGNFVLQHVPSGLAPHTGDSITIEYAPDSSGASSDIIHIFAHGKWGVCDTTITISGNNVSLPQSVTLSQDAITLATMSCLPMVDTLDLSNQGCDVLYLDSVQLGDDSEMSVFYDTTQLPIQSGSMLPIQIVYSPLSRNSKLLTLRLLLHTAQRVIDTTVSIAVSNTIASEPLALSADSLWLFTKYCQPVSLPLNIGNLGCGGMKFDSIAVAGDTLREFSMSKLGDSISAGEWDSTSVTFTPDGTGARFVFVTIYVHENGKAMDTIIKIAAKNLTAPTPYVSALPSLPAGKVLDIPIMLEPTTDTFSIHSYAFHLSFNTDLLTPTDLDFANTCSKRSITYSLTPEPGSGCSGRVMLLDTITDTSQFTLPLIYVKTNVSLTVDTMTRVLLDSFATDREPALGLCSIPEQPFTITMECGDPFLLELLDSQPVSFSFIGVSPNPASAGSWDVDYITRSETPGLTLDIYNAAGAQLSHITDLQTAVGEHHASIPIPNASGDYFLVLGNDHEKTARKGSVAR